MGSNLGWIVRQALEDWISSYILIGDSMISLCWVSSEKKRLSLFHRNRCNQIRRGTELEHIFHVSSEYNPSDLGTRPGTVQDCDVGPNSKWEKGLPWMNREIDDAISNGILTPIADLRLNKEEEEAFNKGLVFEKTHEILTRGHPTIVLTARVEKVKDRAEFSDYLISPTKFKFEKIVRIIATVWRFVKSFKCLEGKLSKKRPDTKFRMFPVMPVVMVIDTMFTKQVLEVYSAEYMKNVAGNNVEDDENIVDTHRFVNLFDTHRSVNLEFGIKKPGIQFKGKFHVLLTDDDFSRSFEYLYKKASKEVKEFNKPDFVKKIAIEKDHQVNFNCVKTH